MPEKKDRIPEFLVAYADPGFPSQPRQDRTFTEYVQAHLWADHLARRLNTEEVVVYSVSGRYRYDPYTGKWDD